MADPVSVLAVGAGPMFAAINTTVTLSRFVFELKNTPVDVKTCLDLVARVDADIQFAISLRTKHLQLLETTPQELQRLDHIVGSASESILDVGRLLEGCRKEAHGGLVPVRGRIKWVLGDSQAFMRRTANLQQQHAAINVEISYLRSLKPQKNANTSTTFENTELLSMGPRRRSSRSSMRADLDLESPPEYTPRGKPPLASGNVALESNLDTDRDQTTGPDVTHESSLDTKRNEPNDPPSSRDFTPALDQPFFGDQTTSRRHTLAPSSIYDPFDSQSVRSLTPTPSVVSEAFSETSQRSKGRVSTQSLGYESLLDSTQRIRSRASTQSFTYRPFVEGAHRVRNRDSVQSLAYQPFTESSRAIQSRASLQSLVSLTPSDSQSLGFPSPGQRLSYIVSPELQNVEVFSRPQTQETTTRSSGTFTHERTPDPYTKAETYPRSRSFASELSAESAPGLTHDTRPGLPPHAQTYPLPPQTVVFELPADHSQTHGPTSPPQEGSPAKYRLPVSPDRKPPPPPPPPLSPISSSGFQMHIPPHRLPSAQHGPMFQALSPTRGYDVAPQHSPSRVAPTQPESPLSPKQSPKSATSFNASPLPLPLRMRQSFPDEKIALAKEEPSQLSESLEDEEEDEEDPEAAFYKDLRLQEEERQRRREERARLGT